jgi:arylsulfatase A-like enzyme
MPSREDLKKAGFDPDAYVGYDRDWYDGSIRGMDAELGRLQERLRGLGLDDKTLVVFTGDHGEEFLDHGRTFHGQTTYGELSNVPLIIRQPGRIAAGSVVAETVETIDVMPTILELCRLKTPAEVQGRSFQSLLSTKRESGAVRAADGWVERPAIVEKAATFEPVGAPPPQDTQSFSIVSGGFKLVWNEKRPPAAREFELYDHRRDPLDQHDLSAERPDLVERLAKDLVAWRQRAESQRLKPDTAGAASMSREDLERLRALGYIQ